MKARGVLVGVALAALGTVTPLEAQDRPAVLPRACEVELALSAAPEHLRDGAGVWVMEDEGYVQARESSNGFACIVNRDDPRSLKPTCFDPEGAATMIPRIELVGGLLLEGTPMQTIGERVEAAFTDEELVRPRRAGIAYMLSPHNRPWNPGAGRLGRFPPHVMVYAPDITSQDIGTNFQARQVTPALPFVGYQGPHGFIIFVSDDIPPGHGDFSACPAWVTEEDPGAASP